MIYLGIGGRSNVEFLVEDWMDFEGFIPSSSFDAEISKKVPGDFLDFDLFGRGGGLSQFHEHAGIEHLKGSKLYKLVILNIYNWGGIKN